MRSPGGHCKLAKSPAPDLLSQMSAAGEADGVTVLDSEAEGVMVAGMELE